MIVSLIDKTPTCSDCNDYAIFKIRCRQRMEDIDSVYFDEITFYSCLDHHDQIMKRAEQVDNYQMQAPAPTS